MNVFLTEPRLKIARCGGGGWKDIFNGVYIFGGNCVCAIFVFVVWSLRRKSVFSTAQFHGVGIDLIDPK